MTAHSICGPLWPDLRYSDRYRVRRRPVIPHTKCQKALIISPELAHAPALPVPVGHSAVKDAAIMPQPYRLQPSACEGAFRPARSGSP